MNQEFTIDAQNIAMLDRMHLSSEHERTDLILSSEHLPSEHAMNNLTMNLSQSPPAYIYSQEDD